MSSGDSSPTGKIHTRFSTPAPELDDHRRRLGVSPRVSRQASPAILPGNKLDIPALELQPATPLGSISGDAELLHIDDVLRTVERTPIARDFENAVDDESGDEMGELGIGRRRDTRRGGRPREIIDRHDRSRDTSSSRSTSPANSLEAFAEPRRRQRANTLDSHASIPDFRQRQQSFDAGTRRPTLSNISIPPALTRGTNEAIPDDITVDFDEEAGKTYKIDFEELDEFVALCNQGLIPGHSGTTSEGSSQQSEQKVFNEIIPEHKFDTYNNVALNGDTFFEKPLELVQSEQTQYPVTSTNEKLARIPTVSRPNEPQRFTFFSSEIQHSKHAARLGDLLATGDSFRDLFEIGPEGGVWWLDVMNPTKAELEVISKAFKIHRLTREDIETQESREKVELFSQYYFVSFRSFNPDQLSEDFLDPLHVYIVVTQEGVLSFSYTANPHAGNVRRRIAKLGDFLSLGPDYICYAMIDDIVDSFAPIIHEAEVESENIEDQVFIARDTDFLNLLKQIGDCRKRVLNMMRLLGGKADVIKGFAKRCNEQYQVTPRGDIGLYLGDIQDHVVTMMSNLGHVEKMLSRSHANYLAQLNVDNILKGNHTNKALAKITVLASIIVPLNIITGLFGMNVHVPGMGEETFAWFGGIVAFMIIFAIGSLVIAKRLRYI